MRVTSLLRRNVLRYRSSGWRHFSSVGPTTETKKEENENVWPGLVASGAGCAVAFPLANFLGENLMKLNYPDIPAESLVSPISGIPVAIILGLTFRHFFPTVSNTLLPGAKIASKQVLQLGIVCVGLKLSAFDLVSTGMVGIPAVALSVVTGLTVIPRIGKALGLPEKMSNLIAAGTSICGITAISAVSPSINATQRDTSFAIANVVTFGTIGLLAYPYFANAVMQSSQQIGMFLGLAIHDTSQVVGAAVTYASVFNDAVVLKVATVTKLTRNLCLAGAVPYLTMKSLGSENVGKQLSILEGMKKHTPTFVYGFIGMSLLRTTGDAFVPEDLTNNWKEVVSFVGGTLGSKVLLGTAMTGVGLSTALSSLKGVGAKPFMLGLAGAATVGTTGFISSYFLLNLLT